MLLHEGDNLLKVLQIWKDMKPKWKKMTLSIEGTKLKSNVLFWNIFWYFKSTTVALVQ
jgi:hypothetical protein